MARVSPEVLAAHERMLAERKAANAAYIQSLRDYKPQARYTREKFVPERSVGAPPRPRMDGVVGTSVIASRAWRGIKMTANTNAKPLGGPGDMRIQGKRLESQWVDEAAIETRLLRASLPTVDHALCDGCGFRIDLCKHEYYNMRDGRMLCETCGA
jgi:hypothetical protein